MSDEVDISKVEAVLRERICAIKWDPAEDDIDRLEARQREVTDIWNTAFASLGLSVTGRSRTESRLRQLYASATNEDERRFVASFLWHWKSQRGLAIADEWLAGDPSYFVYNEILLRYSLCDGMVTFDRFLREFETRQSDPARLTDAIIEFSEMLMYRQRHPRYQEGLAAIAKHLHHPNSRVRHRTASCLEQVQGRA